MTKFTRSEKIEIAGVVSVVISLVFVGTQLILDRRVAMGDQYFNRAEASMANVRALLGSEIYVSSRARMLKANEWPIWWEDYLEPPVAFSEEELATIILRVQTSVLSMDNLRYQYEIGLLNEDYWLNARNILKDDLRMPFYREAYDGLAPNPRMKSLVNSLIAEIESEN